MTPMHSAMLLRFPGINVFSSDGFVVDELFVSCDLSRYVTNRIALLYYIWCGWLLLLWPLIC